MFQCLLLKATALPPSSQYFLSKLLTSASRCRMVWNWRPKYIRPQADGKFPAILEYNPYRRIRKALPNYRDEYPPVVPYLAERGYAVVQYDVRGTGNSGGWTTDIYSDKERRDGYDMVEWAAAQSWCNGNVGMIGKSYSAVVQWQVAVQDPPHLRAIIVRSGNKNVYSDWVYPGGVLHPTCLTHTRP